MNNLEVAVKKALEAGGTNQEANKAYLEFIKANFIIPIDINSAADNPEVLYLQEAESIFLPVFTEMKHFSLWAEEIKDQINILRLSGVDLLKGVGDGVAICLNIGSTTYKEFNPAEIARMRSMVLKLFK